MHVTLNLLHLNKIAASSSIVSISLGLYTARGVVFVARTGKSLSSSSYNCLAAFVVRLSLSQ